MLGGREVIRQGARDVAGRFIGVGKCPREEDGMLALPEQLVHLEGGGVGLDEVARVPGRIEVVSQRFGIAAVVECSHPRVVGLRHVDRPRDLNRSPCRTKLPSSRSCALASRPCRIAVSMSTSPLAARPCSFRISLRCLRSMTRYGVSRFMVLIIMSARPRSSQSTLPSSPSRLKSSTHRIWAVDGWGAPVDAPTSAAAIPGTATISRTNRLATERAILLGL